MKRFLSVALLLMCTACIRLGSDPLPMRHYLLQPNAEAKPLALDRAVIFSLEPPRLPAYLDRLQLTTHDDRNQVLLAPQDRWSEPLEESIPRVLNENLSRYLLDGRTESARGQGAEERKVLIALTINSFDGILGQRTAVDIRWTITASGSPLPVRHGHFIDNAPIGNSAADLVHGLNSALDRFSFALASAVSEGL